MFSRRQFMGGATAGAVLSVIPRFSASAQGLRRYEIIAAPSSQALAGPLDPMTGLLTYNGQSPGPMITGKKGEMLEVVFTNRLAEPTTIHWHGIRNLNEMDGVPGLTQAPVEPGEQFTYRFPLKDAGTFWYHAHQMSWQQVAMGLYGSLVVYDDHEDENAADQVLVFDDWRLDNDYAIDEASFGSLHDWSHGGRLGNWLTVNGASQPEIGLPVSGQVRLRMINAANARLFTLGFENDLPFQVIASDGAACTPFETDRITLGPAQRLDILIDAAGAKALNEVSFQEPLMAARFAPAGSAPGKPDLPSQIPWYDRPDTAGARVIDIHMQGGAMGNLASAEYEGEVKGLRELAMEHSKLWAFNGVVGGMDHLLADLPLGEVTVLNIWNDTRWPHAMHLHGHHFWVNSVEFGAEAPRWLLRDTYLMAPGEKAELVFVADNPGLWLFHCHMLEHHAAGMGGILAVG